MNAPSEFSCPLAWKPSTLFGPVPSTITVICCHTPGVMPLESIDFTTLPFHSTFMLPLSASPSLMRGAYQNVSW